jgi:catechol 2,3-dioxygenase-like lactoylglutathione lyase family enzyme
MTTTEPASATPVIIPSPIGVNHIKLVTPNPEEVNAFLEAVAGVPNSRVVETLGGQGPLGMFGVGAPPTEKHPPVDDGSGVLPLEQVYTTRGADGTGGFSVGDVESRRFQVFRGEEPHIWAVALSSADIEAAHERCKDHGYPVTDIHVVTPFGTPNVRCRFFFTRVGGITFELKRDEAAPAG